MSDSADPAISNREGGTRVWGFKALNTDQLGGLYEVGKVVYNT
jgi:hypothetical protein